MKSKPRLLLAIVQCCLSSAATVVFGQGTAFTYQGRLSTGGSSANGSYDLTFSLFATNTGGVALAGPLTNFATAVTNGLFTTTIDFGPGVFTNAPRWLEIGVRTNGVASFTILSQRQLITPTPYAMYAGNAGAASSVAATNIVGAVPLTPWTSTINAAGFDLTNGHKISLGTPVASIIDNLGAGYNSLKVSVPAGVGDAGKIGVYVVQPSPNLAEMYVENQDGNGKRLGNLTLGVNWFGDGFVGSGNWTRLIDTSSAEPHTTILYATRTNTTVGVSNLTTFTLSVSNLNSSRIVLADAAHNLVSAAASGAMPVNADGSTTSASQINALFPSAVLTNNETQPTTISNNLRIAQNLAVDGTVSGNGSGLSNLSVSSLSGGLTTNYVIPGGATLYITNGVIRAIR